MIRKLTDIEAVISNHSFKSSDHYGKEGAKKWARVLMGNRGSICEYDKGGRWGGLNAGKDPVKKEKLGRWINMQVLR